MEQEIKKNLAYFKIKPKESLCVFMFRCLLNLVRDVITFLKLVTGESSDWENMKAFTFQFCLVSDWEFIQAYEWDEYVQFIMSFSLR